MKSPFYIGDYYHLHETLYILVSWFYTLFKKKYGTMAGSWRGKNVLKRNGIIALGNMKNKESLILLKPLLKDQNPMIRDYTEWAINKINK